MAYKTENGICTITCDKCGATDSSLEKAAGEYFYSKGWVLNQNARKYTHRCRHCLTKKESEARDFVSKFLNI